MLRGNTAQIWKKIVNYAQLRVRKCYKGKGKFSIGNWRYHSKFCFINRECDLFRLFQELPELRKKIPKDFREKTEVHLNWQCCLLRVLIQLVGEQETCKLLDEDNYEVFDSENVFTRVKSHMRDGELLHIAVELGSLRGVKKTVWPGMIGWRDTNNGGKTALELAMQKWGEHHEVTKYLQREVDNLIRSGFETN